MTPPRAWAAVAEACAVVQRGRSLRQDHAGAHAQGAQITCFTSTKVQILTRPLSFMLQSSASFHPLLASLLAMLAKVLTYLLSSTKVQILRCSPRCSVTSYKSTNTETRCLAYNSTITDTPLPRMVPPTACLPACVAREGQKVQIPTLYCYKSTNTDALLETQKRTKSTRSCCSRRVSRLAARRAVASVISLQCARFFCTSKASKMSTICKQSKQVGSSKGSARCACFTGTKVQILTR